MASLDGGMSWQPRGRTAAPAIMGHAAGVLAPGGSALFDERASVEVELVSDAMWLESRSDLALQAGANAAMLGEELIQFGRVEPVGNRRFRLARLLRGRRGTEWAMTAHLSGEPFVLLERERLASIELPTASVGAELTLLGQGIGDGDAAPTAILTVEGRALQPPSPVHLRAEENAAGDIVISWVRRSRSGWSWLGGGDAPLGEAIEAYRLVLTGPGFQRPVDVFAPQFVYTVAQQMEDGYAGTLVARLFQIGTHAWSRPTELSIG
jgi:hypothetical protein